MTDDNAQWRFQGWDSIMIRPSPHTTANTLAAVFTKTSKAGEPLTAIIAQYEGSDDCLRWYTAVVPASIFNAEKDDRDKFPAHTSVVDEKGARNFLLGLGVGENDTVFQQVLLPRPRATEKDIDMVARMITRYFAERELTGATYDAEGKKYQLLPHSKLN